MPEAGQNDGVFESVRQIISDILRIPLEQITADAKISDLGLVESIKLLRIAGKIERRFGIELDDAAIFRNAPLGDLVDEIAKLRETVGEAA